MKCSILHESSGRIRVRMAQKHMSLSQADILEAYLKRTNGVADVKVHDLTCDAVIFYKKKSDKADIISALASFSYEKCNDISVEHSSRVLNREYQNKLFFMLAKRCVNRFILPFWLRTVITLFRSAKYIKAGLKCLIKGKIQVPVLDMTAIVVSIIRGDFATASSIMFLLGIGDILDEWTHKKSVADLAGAMSINVDKVWLERGEESVLVPIRDVKVEDRIIVHTGNMIPLDGKVVSGEALINQSSITGEPLPVRRSEGGYVYAGTVVEEGNCVIQVKKASGSGRYDRIVHMIEESEKLKSETEDHASHLADKLVPYSMGATALIWLLTRNVTKAIAVLMVDFSCALKLSMPVTVLSAMREASSHNISVKGGRFLEAVSQAETIVFDKTGTLTKAEPKVAEVICFGKNDESEMLKLAACLEEHYPHSIAKAVVAEAAARGLDHEERHSKVEYIVAHGISSSVDGKKVIIGSQHFVFEDEKCVVPDGEQDKFNSINAEYSHLYLAVSGVLTAVICIEDPLRPEASEVVSGLRQLGIKNIVMMTGDNEKTARSVAKTVGIDEYYSEVLPEDKANFIRSEHNKGRKVIMLGDGVNDSPALSQADAGIAIRDGAAIAREVADIMIGSDDLNSLLTLKDLSDALMSRIHSNYRMIIGLNFMLIVLGVAGILPPATSALLHNALTIEISLRGMTNLLKE